MYITCGSISCTYHCILCMCNIQGTVHSEHISTVFGNANIIWPTYDVYFFDNPILILIDGYQIPSGIEYFKLNRDHYV